MSWLCDTSSEEAAYISILWCGCQPNRSLYITHNLCKGWAALAHHTKESYLSRMLMAFPLYPFSFLLLLFCSASYTQYTLLFGGKKHMHTRDRFVQSWSGFCPVKKWFCLLLWNCSCPCEIDFFTSRNIVIEIIPHRDKEGSSTLVTNQTFFPFSKVQLRVLRENQEIPTIGRQLFHNSSTKKISVNYCF